MARKRWMTIQNTLVSWAMIKIKNTLFRFYKRETKCGLKIVALLYENKDNTRAAIKKVSFFLCVYGVRSKRTTTKGTREAQTNLSRRFYAFLDLGKKEKVVALW